MFWTEIVERIRGIVAEPSPDFWTDDDLERWYNTGAQMQHRLVFKKAKSLEDRLQYRVYENDYLEQFIRHENGTTVSGTSDYSLPSDFWRLARVVFAGYEADPVHWNEDWDIKNLPHRAPIISRPKFALIPDPAIAGKYKLRLYVAQGQATVPLVTTSYAIHYYSDVVPVDMLASPPVDASLPDPYNDAPIQWAAYQAMTKKHIDGSLFRGEFDRIVDTIIEGPSVEAPGGPEDKRR